MKRLAHLSMHASQKAAFSYLYRALMCLLMTVGLLGACYDNNLNDSCDPPVVAFLSEPGTLSGLFAESLAGFPVTTLPVHAPYLSELPSRAPPVIPSSPSMHSF